MEDEDWTPTVKLALNDYRRIVLSLERPPRVTLLKNIEGYRLVIQRKLDLFLVSSDTTLGIHVAPRYLIPRFPHPLYSKPILEYQEGYAAYVEVLYRRGSTRRTNTVDFITPPSRGDIIKHIPLPKKEPYDSYWFANTLGFSHGKLFVLRDEFLFQVDTSTGNATAISNSFTPPGDDPNKTFRSFGIIGDTLFSYYYRWSLQTVTFVRLNLRSREVDSTARLTISNAYPIAVVSTGKDLLLLLKRSDGQHQFVRIDPRSGSLLETHQPFAPVSSYPLNFASDGRQIWVPIYQWFDNRLKLIDPATGATIRTLPHPVFSPEGLAWDGSAFWTVDREELRIVKFRAAGF